MKRLLLIGVLYALPLFAKDVYNFDELAKATCENSPQLIQKTIQVELANSELDIAKSVYYPTLSLSSTNQYTYKFTDANVPSSIEENSLTQSTQYQSSLSLNLDYELFRFGASAETIEAIKHKIIATNSERYAFAEQLLQNLASTYQQIRILDTKIYYLSKTLELYEKLYLGSKRLFEAGMISQSDVSNYALELAEVLANISRAREQKLHALSELRYLSGVDIGNHTKLAPYGVDSVVFNVKSFEDSFEAKQILSLISQKTKLLQAERKSYFPTISFFARYDAYGESENQFLKSIEDMQRNGYRIGLSIRWNFFDGFKREASIRMKLLELKQAKTALAEARRAYEKEQETLGVLLLEKEHMLETFVKSKETAFTLTTMGDRLHESGEIDNISKLKSKITYYQNLLKEEETKEELIMIKMKQMLKSKGSNRCAIVD